MKGLLLKEWYMMKKYCKTYLLITVVFLAISCVNDQNLFFVVYPCLLCGMIPVNLQSYDERSGWTHYSGTLPYTKAQLVSAKYLTGLFTMLAVLAVTGVIQTIKMSLNDVFHFDNLFVTLLAMFIMTFIFKFGTEKGRIVYFVMIILFFVGIYAISGLFSENLKAEISLNMLLMCLSLAGVVLYALSWFLSISFYKRREM